MGKSTVQINNMGYEWYIGCWSMQSPGGPDRASMIYLMYDTAILANFINLAIGKSIENKNHLNKWCVISKQTATTNSSKAIWISRIVFSNFLLSGFEVCLWTVKAISSLKYKGIDHVSHIKARSFYFSQW